jgi:hypothetical protein
VQLGSFASRVNADKLAHQLKARGSTVYVISSGSGPSLRYRVRMGPLADRGAAERAVVKSSGDHRHSGVVILCWCQWFHGNSGQGSGRMRPCHGASTPIPVATPKVEV